MSFDAQANNELDQEDRRYLPRWEVKNRLLYQVNDQPIFREGHTKDLNCSGACIYVDETLQKNQKVKLTIYLSQDQFISADGKVVWMRLSRDKNLIGINFSNISEKAQELLLNNAFELKKEELTKYWFKGWNGQK